MRRYGQNYGGEINLQVVNVVYVAHCLLKNKLTGASNIVDATAGKGKDTLFLAQNSGLDAEIWAFDIQESALDVTKRLLEQHHVSNKVRLILDSHANIHQYIKKPIDIAMFNLGYLPGGSHDVATHSSSTLEAVEQVLRLLNHGGLLSLVAYPGHEEGQRENTLLQQVFSGLPTRCFTVSKWEMINHFNKPPIFYLIEKVRN